MVSKLKSKIDQQNISKDYWRQEHGMVSGSYECTKTFIQDICHLYLLLSTEEGHSCYRDKANWLMMWLIPWLTTRHVNCRHIDVLCALIGVSKEKNSLATGISLFPISPANNRMTHEINFPCVSILLAGDNSWGSQLLDWGVLYLLVQQP